MGILMQALVLNLFRVKRVEDLSSLSNREKYGWWDHRYVLKKQHLFIQASINEAVPTETEPRCLVQFVFHLKQLGWIAEPFVYVSSDSVSQRSLFLLEGSGSWSKICCLKLQRMGGGHSTRYTVPGVWYIWYILWVFRSSIWVGCSGIWLAWSM